MWPNCGNKRLLEIRDCGIPVGHIETGNGNLDKISTTSSCFLKTMCFPFLYVRLHQQSGTQ